MMNGHLYECFSNGFNQEFRLHLDAIITRKSVIIARFEKRGGSYGF